MTLEQQSNGNGFILLAKAHLMLDSTTKMGSWAIDVLGPPGL